MDYFWLRFNPFFDALSTPRSTMLFKGFSDRHREVSGRFSVSFLERLGMFSSAAALRQEKAGFHFDSVKCMVFKEFQEYKRSGF